MRGGGLSLRGASTRGDGRADTPTVAILYELMLLVLVWEGL